MTIPLVIGSTGHRPDKLGGYGRYDAERLIDLYERALRFYGATRAVTRLAQGSDQCFAQACIHAGIPYDAIVPFPTESERWPHRAQHAYMYLLGRAASVHTVSLNATCANASYQMANMEIVDRCEILFTLWSGAPGGTANCIRYAQQGPSPRAIVPFWKEWEGL